MLWRRRDTDGGSGCTAAHFCIHTCRWYEAIALQSRATLSITLYDISLLVQLSMLFVLLPSVLLPVGLLASRSIRAHLSTLSLCLPCFLLFASCPGLPLVSGPPCEAPKSSSWRWDGRRRWTRTDTSSIDETEKISIAFRSLSSPCSLSLSLLLSLPISLSLSLREVGHLSLSLSCWVLPRFEECPPPQQHLPVSARTAFFRRCPYSWPWTSLRRKPLPY